MPHRRCNEQLRRAQKKEYERDGNGCIIGVSMQYPNFILGDTIEMNFHTMNQNVFEYFYIVKCSSYQRLEVKIDQKNVEGG